MAITPLNKSIAFRWKGRESRQALIASLFPLGG